MLTEHVMHKIIIFATTYLRLIFTALNDVKTQSTTVHLETFRQIKAFHGWM